MVTRDNSVKTPQTRWHQWCIYTVSKVNILIAFSCTSNCKLSLVGVVSLFILTCEYCLVIISSPIKSKPKTIAVARITYSVLVETLYHAQSINHLKQLTCHCPCK